MCFRNCQILALAVTLNFQKAFIYTFMFALTNFLLWLTLLCISQSFKIAVVEFEPVDNPALSPSDRLSANAKKYTETIDRLSKEKVNLIVFPEATLYYGRHLRDKEKYSSNNIEKGVNPCSRKKSFKDFMSSISCACRKVKVYISFTIIEQSNDDKKYFSTMLVFDTEGAIMAINRNDDEIGSPDLKQVPGLPFQIPMLNEFLVYTENKTGLSLVQTTALYGYRYSYEKMFNINLTLPILYLIPSNWISELPFLTAPQMYQMWADEYKVAILYAGCHVEKSSFGGSGALANNISASTYKASGEIIFDVDLEALATKHKIAGKVLTTQPQKVDELAAQMDNFSFRTNGAIRDYTSELMDLKETVTQTRVCSQQFCCNIAYKIAVDEGTIKKESYVYHLVAFSGLKHYHDIFNPGGVQTCGIIACLNKSITSCGQRFPKYGDVSWPVTFEEITVSATFGSPYKQGKYHNMQFPNSLLSSMRPISSAETDWTQNIINDVDNIHQVRVFKLVKPQNRLMTFGIFARDFFISKSEKNVALASVLFVLNICLFFI